MAGRFDPKVFVNCLQEMSSWQRPSGQNVLHWTLSLCLLVKWHFAIILVSCHFLHRRCASGSWEGCRLWQLWRNGRRYHTWLTWEGTSCPRPAEWRWQERSHDAVHQSRPGSPSSAHAQTEGRVPTPATSPSHPQECLVQWAQTFKQQLTTPPRIGQCCIVQWFCMAVVSSETNAKLP